MMERPVKSQGRPFGWHVAMALGIAALAATIAGFFGPSDRALAQQVQRLPAQIGPAQLGGPNGPFVQFGRRVRAGDTESEGTDGVFLPSDRDSTRQFDRAKQWLEEGRYSDAATLLDEILKRGEDYFFKPEDNNQVHRSLKMEAQRLIGNMPPEGRKAYELLFGTRAQQMLAEAAAEGDIPKLESLSRRFFHTQAGYQATLLLGRRYLDHAQPLAAALCFQRLLDTPHAAQAFEPSLSMMTALSWLRGGMNDRAGEVLVALRKRNPKADVRIGAEKVPAFPDGRTAVAWLQSTLGKPKRSSALDDMQWAMHRGNPSRNSIASGGVPLLNPRWRVSTTNHPTLEKTLIEMRKRYSEEGVASLPVMQPLAVGDLVLMRTPREVLAVDFTTGKRLWPIRTSDSSWGTRQTPEFPFGAQQGIESQINSGLADKFWTDATQGTMSSDGTQVYLIQESVDRSERRNTSDPRLQLQFEFAKPYNVLTACELQTQGKLKWRVGGPNGDDEPQLAGAFFLGPPLPLHGKLYALAEINGEIKLCVLESATGRLEWSQQLAVVEQTIMQDSLRMLAGCSPSFADGILVCPTTAGAVVAVDVSNRSLLWAFQYPRQLQQIYRNPFAVPANVSGASERWCDSAVIVADGRVLVTPLESEDFHCLSLVDGKPLWKSVQRGENLYIGGVHGGKVILVGKRGVSALRLTDGQPAWQKPIELPAGALPSGRGYLSGNEYYLPLTTAEVAKIDLTSEKITHLARSRKGSVPGNLICYRGEVISQGVDYVESFYQLEPLQMQIAKALDRDAGNAWALAHRSEIQLEQGRLDQAVADIRRAYEVEPSPFTRDLLVEVFTAALARDFSKYQGVVAELEPLVQFDAERAKFLRVVATGLQQQGKTSGALAAYLKLADLPALPDDDMDEVDTKRKVRRDRWIRANINELIASASVDERAKIDAVIEERLQMAAGDRGPNRLRQFLNYFGDHPAGDRARELLVAPSSSATALLEREQLLRKLEQSSDTNRRKEAAVRFAALLRDAGQEQAALAYYRRLAKEFGDAPLVDGKSVGQMLESLPDESPLRRAADRQSSWPIGEVIAEKGTSTRARNNPFMPALSPIDFRGPRGPFFSDLTIGWYQQTGGELVARDGWGAERFRLSLNDSQRGGYGMAPGAACVVAYNHLLVLYTGSQVVGIDTLRAADGSAGRVLWRQDVADGGANNTYFDAAGGRVRWTGRVRSGARSSQPGCLGLVNSNGVFLQRGREVMALDPLSGKPLWTQQVDSANCEIFGDEELIIVAPSDSGAKAQVLRTIDGQVLGTCSLPTVGQRWLTYGRYVLAWTAMPDGKQQLRMIDPWGNRDVWEQTFAADVKGVSVDDETIALMQRDGRFVTMSLADGKIVIDEKLAAEPKLDGIYVVRSAEHDILVVNSPAGAKQSPSRRRNVQLQLEGLAPIVSGRVYAFDRASGKLQWPTAGSVEEHGLLLSQPSELPVLLFLRIVSDGDAANPSARGSLLCIDKRTGRLVYEDDTLPQQVANNFEVTTDFDAKTITLTAFQTAVTLKFTDKPVAPEPPYQANLASGGSWDFRKAVGDTLKSAWENTNKPEAAPVKINQDPFAPGK